MSTYGYLAHHGVKGQKWGIRRYQNPDGSLTAAGKKRYYDKEGNERKIYPVVTGDRRGIGRLSFFTGNYTHPHGSTMSLRKADKYLQKSMDKGRISNVYKDPKTHEDMVTLTDKGAKRLNLLAKFPKSAETKGGESLMADYYIQMQRGFAKDIVDRSLKRLGALAAAGVIAGGAAYVYGGSGKGKNAAPTMDEIKKTIDNSLNDLPVPDLESWYKEDEEQNIKDFGQNYRDTKDWYRKK